MFQCCMSSREKFLVVHPCHSRTYRWESDSAWIARSRRYSIQLVRIDISQMKFFQLYFNSRVRTRCWRMNKQRWSANSFLPTSQSDIWDGTRRNIDKRRLHETKNGTLPKQVETFSGRCLLGQFSQSTRHRNTILAHTVECHCCVLFCTTRMHLQAYFSKWSTSFFFWETRDASISTKSCNQKSLAKAAAATAAARHIWKCISSQLETLCGNFGEGRDAERFQETQQRSQKPLAAGYCCGVMCQTSLMLKKSLNSKSTPELKDLLTM